MMLFLASPALANTVTSERTEVTLTSDVSALHAGEKFMVALHIKMQPGWHTYWKNPGDSGMVPDLHWTLPNGFTAGEIQFPAPKRLPIGDMVDYGYENDVWLLVPVTPPAILRENATSILMLKARWLVCKDICIPESGEFSLSFPTVAAAVTMPGMDAAAIAEVVKTLPSPAAGQLSSYAVNGTLVFDLPLNTIPADKIKTVEFFPDMEGLVVNNAPQKFEVRPDRITLTLKQETGKLPDKTQGLVSVFLDNNERKDFAVALKLETQNPAAEASAIRTLTALLFAFLGGLILNLMPCVFPVLALKALAIAKKAEKHKSQIRVHGMAYAIGVILSFIVLASVLIIIQISGKSIGWGYQMQSPVFVSVLTAVFFLVGLNLSGFFEFPTLFGNAGQGVAAKDSLLGSFATGVLAVMVATPCTAPFMASAIGFALTQTIQVILLVFASIGLGLAAPFLLLSLFPALIRILPKPGSWMLTFKQLIAFPMYISALWLLWVLSREAGINAVFIMLLGLIGLSFAVWLAKKRAWLTGLLLLAIIASAIAWQHMPHPVEQAPLASEKFSVAGLEALRAQGKAVFVDATADWCITCKVNENVALSSKKVRNLFAEKNITTMVADWTHEDKEITGYLQSFGRAGVPIYVYYPPGGEDPVVLPQILTESIVIEAVK